MNSNTCRPRGRSGRRAPAGSRSRPPAPPASGFTVAESLVALALVTLALLLGITLLLRQPQALERLRAGEEALRAAEAALETLRAGALPLESAVLLPPEAYPPTGEARRLRLRLQVRPLRRPPGLYQVTVEASYLVGGEVKRRRVQSLVWR